MLTLTEIEQELNLFGEELKTAIPDNILSVIIYGGLAKGEFKPETSDINLMIVLRDASNDTLKQIAPIIQKKNSRISMHPFIITENELRIAPELFPIKFLDIKTYHKIISGTELLSTLNIPNDKLIYACKQELQNLYMRLRSVYSYSTELPEVLEFKIKKTFSSLLVNMNALIYVKTGVMEKAKDEIISKSSSLFSLDQQLLSSIKAIRNNTHSYSPEEIKKIYENFMTLLNQIIQLEL